MTSHTPNRIRRDANSSLMTKVRGAYVRSANGKARLQLVAKRTIRPCFRPAPRKPELPRTGQPRCACNSRFGAMWPKTGLIRLETGFIWLKCPMMRPKLLGCCGR